MITIIDIKLGNIRSIVYKLQRIGFQIHIARAPEDLMNPRAIIFPGVGHFAAGMNNLRAVGLDKRLNECVLNDKVPILGICLGMQLFARSSEEGFIEGLGWLNADVRRLAFQVDQTYRIPHVGWDVLEYHKSNRITQGIDSTHKYYFTHSYYMECHDPEDVVAYANYGYRFPSIINHENIYGTQFHPEKSHEVGFEVIKNFIKMNV